MNIYKTKKFKKALRIVKKACKFFSDQGKIKDRFFTSLNSGLVALYPKLIDDFTLIFLCPEKFGIEIL